MATEIDEGLFEVDQGLWASLAVASTDETVRAMATRIVVEAFCTKSELPTDPLVPEVLLAAAPTDRARLASAFHSATALRGDEERAPVWRAFLDRLARDAEPKVRASVAFHLSFWLTEQPELAAIYEADRNIFVRASYQPSSDLLESLAAHPCWDVRVLACAGPPAALRDLARQTVGLRRLVARCGPPADVVQALCRDEDAEVRKWTASRLMIGRAPKTEEERSVHVEAAQHLANDPVVKVRFALARNRWGLPRDIFAKLATDRPHQPLEVGRRHTLAVGLALEPESVRRRANDDRDFRGRGQLHDRTYRPERRRASMLGAIAFAPRSRPRGGHAKRTRGRTPAAGAVAPISEQKRCRLADPRYVLAVDAAK